MVQQVKFSPYERDNLGAEHQCQSLRTLKGSTSMMLVGRHLKDDNIPISGTGMRSLIRGRMLSRTAESWAWREPSAPATPGEFGSHNSICIGSMTAFFGGRAGKRWR